MEQVLESFRRARDSYRTLHTIVRIWQDPNLASEVWTRWTSARQLGSTAKLAPNSRRDATEPVTIAADPISSIRTDAHSGHGQAVLEVWMEKPWRWRVVALADSEAVRGATIIDGNRWWHLASAFDPAAGTGPPGTQTAVGLPVALMTALDPERLRTSLALQFVARINHHGREALRVLGTPSSSDDDFGLGPGADSYSLVFDVERGVLLELAVRAGDLKYRGIDLVSPDFDVEPPPDAFTTR
jgi:hypothetical protein